MSQTQPFLGSPDTFEQQREYLHRVLDLAINFKTQPEVCLKPASDLKDFTPSPVPNSERDLADLLSDFKEIAAKSTNFGSSRFVGFPDAGNSMAALSGAIFYPFLNQNMINQDFCAPEATFAEIEVIHWLRQLVGYNTETKYERALDVGGCSVTGGVLANTIALLAAREKAFPGTMQSGIVFDVRKAKVLVAAGINHYSIKMAMAWLGIGQDNLIEVPITQDFRLDQIELNRIIETESSEGNRIFACIAYAGDSRTMAVDDLSTLANILAKAKIHFHIDACHGLQLLFSQKHRSKMSGAELADSITFDPHKVLWIPYCSSFVLFKNTKDLAQIASASDLITKEKWSLGQTTPFLGSKDFHSLKLWSLIKHLGIERIGELIDERLELTANIARQIDKTAELKLLNKTDINSCMFAYYPNVVDAFPLSSEERIDLISKINHRIKESLRISGKAYVHGFPISLPAGVGEIQQGASIRVLRIMNGNPLTGIADITDIIEEIVRLGNQFLLEEIDIMKGRPAQKREVFSVVTKWCELSLPKEDVQAIIYGSSVLQKEHALLTSDLDLMIIASDSAGLQGNVVETFLRCLHSFYSLPLDNEIPFERKLIIPRSFVERVITLGAFPRKNGRPIIRPINKAKEYLESDEMLRRLVMNVLTCKTSLVFGDCTSMIESQRRACLQMTRTVIAQKGNFRDPKEIYSFLFKNGNRVGEDHLGYKNHPTIRRHVFNWVQRTVSKINSPQLVPCR